LQVLITRPEPQASGLADLANELGVNSRVLPLLSIVMAADLRGLDDLNHADIVIAVSKHAVKGASDYLNEQNRQWPDSCQYLAVGQQSAEAWYKEFQSQTLNISQPIWPIEQNSEGLLQLEPLQDVSGKHIVILRGNAGREFLVEQLRLRGALVKYISCYRREALENNLQKLGQLIPKKKVGSYVLIVTSAEQLQLVVDNIGERQLEYLSVMVPSIRVANIAKEMGFLSIYQSQGATNRAIIEKIKELKA